MRYAYTMKWLAAAFVLFAAPARVQAAVCGDLTNNGSRQINDVAAILTCVANASTCAAQCGGTGALSCADMNQDGAITIADAVILLNDVLGKQNILPICTSAGPTLACGSVIAADITSNEVLASCTYFLDGTVFVQPGVVLTIQPGATIKGLKVSADSTPSALIFLRGTTCTAGETTFSARINAVGTPSKPIIFTSDQPVGSRALGDWGGVAFNGCSQVNFPTGVGESEGLVGVEFGHGPGGGLTPLLNDFSGVARYVRVEFAGRELVVDNELNAWTMNALGSNTQFDHIQAHMGNDDGFEWFGGTNKAKYLVATANNDDNFDWQIGSEAGVQYAYAQQYGPSLSSAGSHGFEADNNETGFSNTPVSNPRFCNVTIIGAKDQGGHVTTASYAGAFLRRGTAGKIAKTIITNMTETGLQLRDPETAAHACTGTCLVGGVARTNGTSTCDAPPFSLPGSGPTLELLKDIFFNNGPGGTVHAKNKSGGNNTGSQCNSSEFFALETTAGDALTVDPGLGVTWPNADPRPSNVANVTDALDCGAAFGDPFFESNTYIGAFDPNGTNWLDTPGGWISFITQ